MTESSSHSSGDKEEAKLCRICLAGPEDEKDFGRLIKPCMCKGSMQVSLQPKLKAFIVSLDEPT